MTGKKGDKTYQRKKRLLTTSKARRTENNQNDGKKGWGKGRKGIGLVMREDRGGRKKRDSITRKAHRSEATSASGKTL